MKQNLQKYYKLSAKPGETNESNFSLHQQNLKSPQNQRQQEKITIIIFDDQEEKRERSILPRCTRKQMKVEIQTKFICISFLTHQSFKNASRAVQKFLSSCKVTSNKNRGRSLKRCNPKASDTFSPVHHLFVFFKRRFLQRRNFLVKFSYLLKSQGTKESVQINSRGNFLLNM